MEPGACFSKASETFRARKAIFSWSVSTNGEVYTHETSCMKRNSVHIKNVWLKQLCNRKARYFDMASWARKVSGAFEKRATGRNSTRVTWLGGLITELSLLHQTRYCMYLHCVGLIGSYFYNCKKSYFLTNIRLGRQKMVDKRRGNLSVTLFNVAKISFRNSWIHNQTLFGACRFLFRPAWG